MKRPADTVGIERQTDDGVALRIQDRQGEIPSSIRLAISRGYAGMIASFRNRLFGPKGSLRHRTAVGGQWQVMRSGALAVVDVAKTAVFARILFPEDYGLMALATMAIGMMEAISTLGIETMVQRDDDRVADRLSAYWTLRFVVGMVLTAAAWAMALPLAGFYERPGLIPLIRFLSVLFVLRGISGFGIEMCQRRMAFARVAVAEIISAVVILVVGIGVLFWLKNVWALAVYMVLAATGRTVISYALYPWRPRWHWSTRVSSTVVLFGGGLIVTHLLTFIFQNTDRAIVGKILGVDTLGLYARAHFLAIIPSVYLFNTVATSVLQAYRRLSHDPRRFRLGFTRILIVFIAAAIAIAMIGYAAAEPIVRLLYGERWLPLIPIFQILLIFGACRGAVAACSPVFLVVGRPWRITVSTALSVTVFLVLCPIWTRSYGSVGAAWAVVAAGGMSLVSAIVLAYGVLGQWDPPTTATGRTD